MENLMMYLGMSVILLGIIALVVIKGIISNNHIDETAVIEKPKFVSFDNEVNDDADKISIIGTLIADPVLRTVNTSDGETSVIGGQRMRVAVRYDLSGHITECFNYVVWGKAAELLAKHAKKGMQVMFSGKCAEDTYVTKAGEEVISKTITVDLFTILSKAHMEETVNLTSVNDEDVPF